jgi:hypothetical protein
VGFAKTADARTLSESGLGKKGLPVTTARANGPLPGDG